jgi:hypothetical protein
MKLRTVAVVVAATCLSACISHYRYESQGTVKLRDREHKAFLYWHRDEGGLWYREDQPQTDSGIEFIVCGQTPKTFAGGEADEPLILRSRFGDKQVYNYVGSELIRLPAPVELPEGGNCGTVAVDGVPVPSAKLGDGDEPAVILLCDNPRRYPRAEIYTFGEISRTRVEKDRDPPNYCQPDQAGNE